MKIYLLLITLVLTACNGKSGSLPPGEELMDQMTPPITIDPNLPTAPVASLSPADMAVPDGSNPSNEWAGYDVNGSTWVQNWADGHLRLTGGIQDPFNFTFDINGWVDIIGLDGKALNWDTEESQREITDVLRNRLEYTHRDIYIPGARGSKGNPSGALSVSCERELNILGTLASNNAGLRVEVLVDPDTGSRFPYRFTDSVRSPRTFGAREVQTTSHNGSPALWVRYPNPFDPRDDLNYVLFADSSDANGCAVELVRDRPNSCELLFASLQEELAVTMGTDYGLYNTTIHRGNWVHGRQVGWEAYYYYAAQESDPQDVFYDVIHFESTGFGENEQCTYNRNSPRLTGGAVIGGRVLDHLASPEEVPVNPDDTSTLRVWH